MTGPQVWTIIGSFIASTFGMMTLMSSIFVRTLRTEIGGVRREIASLRNELKSDIASVRSEIGALEARMDSKFHTLDRDVQALVRREWGDPKP